MVKKLWLLKAEIQEQQKYPLFIPAALAAPEIDLELNPEEEEEDKEEDDGSRVRH